MERVYIEKKGEFDIECNYLLKELRDFLDIKQIESLRILNRYDFLVEDDVLFTEIKQNILADSNVEELYENEIPLGKDDLAFAVEFLPGQHDQRADSLKQCIQILSPNKKDTDVRVAKVIIVNGPISDDDFENIKEYCINPVDSREIPLESLESTGLIQ